MTNEIKSKEKKQRNTKDKVNYEKNYRIERDEDKITKKREKDGQRDNKKSMRTNNEISENKKIAKNGVKRENIEK